MLLQLPYTLSWAQRTTVLVQNLYRLYPAHNTSRLDQSIAQTNAAPSSQCFCSPCKNSSFFQSKRRWLGFFWPREHKLRYQRGGEDKEGAQKHLTKSTRTHINTLRILFLIAEVCENVLAMEICADLKRHERHPWSRLHGSKTKGAWAVILWCGTTTCHMSSPPSPKMSLDYPRLGLN